MLLQEKEGVKKKGGGGGKSALHHFKNLNLDQNLTSVVIWLHGFFLFVFLFLNQHRVVIFFTAAFNQQAIYRHSQFLFVCFL